MVAIKQCKTSTEMDKMLPPVVMLTCKTKCGCDDAKANSMYNYCAMRQVLEELGSYRRN